MGRTFLIATLAIGVDVRAQHLIHRGSLAQVLADAKTVRSFLGQVLIARAASDPIGLFT